MLKARPLTALAATVFATALLASPLSAFEWPDWQSVHFRDNPLAGSIWRGEGSEVSRDVLSGAVVAAEYVLLGEIHTNPDHHLIQAMLIGEMIAAGRRPAVVFEMIPTSVQERLDDYLAASPGDASGIGPAVDWQTRGWPDWSIYQPIAAVALGAGLKLKASDLDRSLLQQIGKTGAAALDPAVRERFGLNRSLAADLKTALMETLKQSHCNLLPEATVTPMLTVQRARDGALAEAMLNAGKSDGAVLIAGTGHVRRDWAVPALIANRLPEAKIVSVALFEVEAGLNTFSEYDFAPDGADLPFDFVVFTPRADLTDHCAELAKRFGKKSPQKSQ